MHSLIDACHSPQRHTAISLKHSPELVPIAPFEHPTSSTTMEDPTPIVPGPQKRPREEDAEPQPTTPVKVISSQASTPLSVLSNIQTPSPMRTLVNASTVVHSVERNCTPSIAITTNTIAASEPSPQTVPDLSSTQQPTKKKRKVLTQQEKDDTAREKDVKAKAKVDKAARKEIEARLKADEKALKAAQKEAEIKTKAEEKAKKEEEKAKKEAEKAKREAERAKKEAEKREREEEKAKKERVSALKNILNTSGVRSGGRRVA